jgi:hypothetical protein
MEEALTLTPPRWKKWGTGCFLGFIGLYGSFGFFGLDKIAR